MLFDQLECGVLGTIVQDDNLIIGSLFQLDMFQTSEDVLLPVRTGIMNVIVWFDEKLLIMLRCWWMVVSS